MDDYRKKRDARLAARVMRLEVASRRRTLRLHCQASPQRQR
jgi:hypothetical protein